MYDTCIKKYGKISAQLESFPLTPQKVIGFLEFLRSNKQYTYNTISNYLHSLAFSVKEHKNEYTSDPTKSTEVRKYMQGLSRVMLSGTPPKRSDNMTPELLNYLTENTDKSNYYAVRDMAHVALSYAGFLRISEAAKLKWKNVTFDSDHLTIQIVSSKTDVTGRGSKVTISRTDNKYCAFKWIKALQNLSDTSGENLVFQCSAESLRRRFNSLINSTTIPHGRITPHGLRRGGAHQAAINGVQDSAIKPHGRWVSNIFHEYTDLTAEEAGPIVTTHI